MPGLDFDSITTAVGGKVQQRQDDVQSIMQGGNLDNPANLAKLQMAVSKWTAMQQLQSSITKELGDALKGIIQKMG